MTNIDKERKNTKRAIITLVSITVVVILIVLMIKGCPPEQGSNKPEKSTTSTTKTTTERKDKEEGNKKKEEGKTEQGKPEEASNKKIDVVDTTSPAAENSVAKDNHQPKDDKSKPNKAENVIKDNPSGVPDEPNQDSETPTPTEPTKPEDPKPTQPRPEDPVDPPAVEVYHTIRYCNYDGAILHQVKVKDRENAPDYSGPKPMKPEDEGHTYSFSGWDDPSKLLCVTEDRTVVAVFSTSIKQFTVRFCHYNGVVWKAVTVNYRENVKVPEDNPIRPGNAQFDFEFLGWDDPSKLECVTEDRYVTATYRAILKEYKIIFMNGDAKVSEETKAYGTVIGKPEMDPKSANDNKQYTYPFIGWYDNPECRGEAVDFKDLTVTGDHTFYAKFGAGVINQYKVVFMNGDTKVSEETLAYGSVISKPATDPESADNDAQYTHPFLGWYDNPECVGTAVDFTGLTVTGEHTFYAKFAEGVINQFTVTFKSDGGEVLGTVTVDYGATASDAGIDTAKEADAQYTYTFAGWDDPTLLQNVTSNREVRATYTKEAKDKSPSEGDDKGNAGDGSESGQKPGDGDDKNNPGGGSETGQKPGDGDDKGNVSGSGETGKVPGDGNDSGNVTGGGESGKVPGDGNDAGNVTGGGEGGTLPGDGNDAGNVNGGEEIGRNSVLSKSTIYKTVIMMARILETEEIITKRQMMSC